MSDDEDEIDPLDEFLGLHRKEQPSATIYKLQLPPKLEGKQPYVAMVTQDKTEGFILDCPSSGQEHYYKYHYLQPITTNKPAYDFFFFKAAGYLVTVYGHNLYPVIMALWTSHCRSLTEYSPERHLPPTDPAAPFIERITVAVLKRAEDADEAAKLQKRVLSHKLQGGE